jgi:hypothetical protein
LLQKTNASDAAPALLPALMMQDTRILTVMWINVLLPAPYQEWSETCLCCGMSYRAFISVTLMIPTAKFQ